MWSKFSGMSYSSLVGDIKEAFKDYLSTSHSAKMAAPTLSGTKFLRSEGVQRFCRFLSLTSCSSSEEHEGRARKYGGRYTVTLIPGDGVGPELASFVKDVYKYASVPVDFEQVDIDADKPDEEELFKAVTAIRRNRVALMGNFKTRFLKPGYISKNVGIRQQLDLFSNVMHCKTLPSIKVKHQDVDIVMIRENTEGEYSGLDHESVPGVVESLKIITKEKSERVARYAFHYASRHGRKKVTAIHKANIMKLGDGLFLNTCEEVSKDYPDIEFNDMIVDNCCMQLVSRPQQFDVMVLPNLYGNIVGNIGCALVGGPGIVPGRNIGSQYAVFETGSRHSGLSIAGQDVANPTAMLLAAADLCKYLRLEKHSDDIRTSVLKVLTEDKIHTPDLGGTAKSSEFVAAVIDDIASKNPASGWL